MNRRERASPLVQTRASCFTQTIVKERYENDGFMIVRHIFSGARLSELQAIAERYYQHSLTKGITGRHSMHDPAMEGQWEPELFNCLNTPRILQLSEELKECKLRSTYYEFNSEVPGKENSMFWHQDKQFLSKSLPEGFDAETFCQEVPFSQIQWNVALEDDAALQVVPGSHRRELTEEERSILTGNRFNPSMPGSLCVELKAGDGVVYHSNIIHGVYNPQPKKRRTLHWYWVGRDQYDPYRPDYVPLPGSLMARLDPVIAEMHAQALHVSLPKG